MKKILRVATHSGSLGKLLEGQLQFMSEYYDVVGIGSAGKYISGKTTIKKLAEKENIRVIPVEIAREISLLKDIKALYKLYKIFKREKPFIVHSHTPKAGTLSMIAAKMAKVPHRLHTVAGLPLVEATGVKRQILNIVEKVTYFFATKVYPNSFGLQDIIINNNFTNHKKMKVIGKGSSNGINTSYFDPSLYSSIQNDQLRKELFFSQSDFVFIFLGRIVKDKGINELIEAFQQLSNKYDHIRLLLVGYYNKSTALLSSETEKEIELNKQITFLDWKEDVRPYLSIANALVFPSYREGFPNTVLQSSAMKLPCIVSDINGCNEIIKDGFNGIIIPIKDSISLKNSMEKLLLDKEYYGYLAKNSREFICENYEQKFIWKSLLEEYKQLEKVKV